MPKIFAVILLGLLTLDGNINLSSSPITRVDSDIIGPFNKFQEDEVITITYQTSGNVEIYEELRYSDPVSGTNYGRTKKAVHKTPKFLNSIKFTLPLKKYFGDNGLKFTFTIFSKGNETLYTNSFTLNPRDERVINVTKDKVQRIESKEVACKFENSVVSTYKDDFNFVGFKDYIDTENYYKLDVKKNYFLYNYDTINYESATLTIEDQNNVFKYMSHTNGNISLNLELTNSKTKKGFKYKDNLYVNRLTLDTSTYKMTDFVKTKMLYLPINSKKAFLGSKMHINVYGCGYNKYDLTFDMNYDVARNLIGNCYDSDYCIVGEIS